MLTHTRQDVGGGRFGLSESVEVLRLVAELAKIDPGQRIGHGKPLFLMRAWCPPKQAERRLIWVLQWGGHGFYRGQAAFPGALPPASECGASVQDGVWYEIDLTNSFTRQTRKTT